MRAGLLLSLAGRGPAAGERRAAAGRTFEGEKARRGQPPKYCRRSEPKKFFVGAHYTPSGFRDNYLYL
jgi:hypothetical protein